MPEILYEDNHIIAVNKKCSELVQGDKTGDISLDQQIKSYLKNKYNKSRNVFLGITHRIDRPASGVVIFAKTSKSLERLNKLFHDKKIEKTYWAIIKNKPPKESDDLSHFLVRKPSQNKSFSYDKKIHGSKLASLSYKVIGNSENYYLLEIKLHTGRHHQIRSQLSKINCPIKGDLKYNFPRSNKNGGISLHAKEISFIHPVKNTFIKIVAPVPKDDIWDKFDIFTF
ncbi:MAG: RluA family pseudouridine synthase [Bacteroidales bacterium]|nr:RluA family pseudouridine synthase [Bacteroidales bacterium]